MKSVLSVIVGSCLLIGTSACVPFEPNDNVLLGVTKLDAPPTVSATASFTVTVTVVTGGCTSFNRIDVQRFDQGVRLIPLGTNASIRHEDITCPDIIKEEPHEVQLDPPFANPFTILVEQGVQPAVTATVQVQ